MAWLDSVRDKKEQEKLPERLRGKSPEDIMKELQAADDLKKELELAKTAQRSGAEAATALRSEVDEIKARLAAAEANRQPLPKKEDDEQADFITDPDKAFGQRAAPIANATILNASMTARILAQQQLDNDDLASQGQKMDGRLFRAWSGELDAESKKYQAAQLVTPNAWIGIFMYLKGIHADEMRDPEVRKKKYNFLEPSVQHALPPTNQDGKPATEQLTKEELHVAEKMGVSPENYLKRKKAMQYVNS